MRKLLVIYNTSEILCPSNVPHYIDSLRSILSQTIYDSFGEDFKVAVSGCMMTDRTKQQLYSTFGNHLSYNFVEENLPLSITFNDTIDRCTERYGEFEGYLYVDSGIDFWDPCQRFDALQRLWDVYKSGPYAITNAMPSNDDGSSWWGIQYKQGEDFIFPVGKTTNLHCAIFSQDWKSFYKRVLPDIFASNAMESVFPHMSAAIHRKNIITQKVHVKHMTNLDGASGGSRMPSPDRIPMSDTFQTGGQLFKTKKTIDKKYVEGYQFGAGFEECVDYWKHDPSKFDSEGYALDPALKEFYKKEVYLSQDEFDYRNIRRIFIPGR